jgi:hypothetical protein
MYEKASLTLILGDNQKSKNSRVDSKFSDHNSKKKGSKLMNLETTPPP